MCYRCEESINDPFVIDVGGFPWHADCLRCCVCTTALDEERTCYVRRNKIYCKEDYFKYVWEARRVFAIGVEIVLTPACFLHTRRTCIARCAKCCREISPSDWVRKAKDAVYHLACFSCDTCDRQLSTGEQFAMLSDQILCREHYMETMEIETGSSDDSVGSTEKKSKRVRTAFTEEQLEVLNRSFEVDNNPDGQDLERIAVSAGLSKRVTQVWFQNSRARQKKHSYQHKRNRRKCGAHTLWKLQSAA